jgi:hypothetical protein
MYWFTTPWKSASIDCSTSICKRGVFSRRLVLVTVLADKFVPLVGAELVLQMPCFVVFDELCTCEFE